MDEIWQSIFILGAGGIVFSVFIFLVGVIAVVRPGRADRKQTTVSLSTRMFHRKIDSSVGQLWCDAYEPDRFRQATEDLKACFEGLDTAIVEGYLFFRRYHVGCPKTMKACRQKEEKLKELVSEMDAVEFVDKKEEKRQLMAEIKKACNKILLRAEKCHERCCENTSGLFPAKENGVKNFVE
ncbi:MAG: uncharacterized protein A8A55_2429 [Amphiamblys sp. WSBS2006]|nr:MAG: uncharacterized protein A8A55_2429 [Amphiamblys sp. WSBS2006]